jgi:hypothetical protein
MWRLLALLLSGFVTMPEGLPAQDRKVTDGPRITAIVPLSVAPGGKTTLLIRGLKLTDATALVFPGAPALAAEIKTKKAAELPAGAEAKDIGDTQLEAILTVPAEQPIGTVTFRIDTPGGNTPTRELRIAATADALEEKEPNDGFREAQPCELGRTIRGTLKSDKDVDVFGFSAAARTKVTAEVFAARGSSLLDSILNAIDPKGHVLATSDDANERDAQLTFEVPAGGRFMIAIQDAGDRGSAWHGYELLVKETP